MKRFVSVLIVFIVPAIMIACGKKNENKNDDTAATPLTSSCLTSNCGSAAYYNSYYRYGFKAYTAYGYSNYGYNYFQYYYNYGYSSCGGYGGGYNNTQMGFAGCGYGFQTVYHNSYGLGCVDSRYLINGASGYNGMYAFWYLNGANQTWNNTPQVSNISTNNYNINSCGGALQVCDIRQANTCPSGYTCRATYGSVDIGVCGQ